MIILISIFLFLINLFIGFHGKINPLNIFAAGFILAFIIMDWKK